MHRGGSSKLEFQRRVTRFMASVLGPASMHGVLELGRFAWRPSTLNLRTIDRHMGKEGLGMVTITTG
jgi:hypothetical protein